MAPLETIEYKGHTIDIYHDDVAQSPAEWGNFTIVQFADNNKIAYQYKFGSDYVTSEGKLTPATQAKLRAGKMFPIRYRNYSSAGNSFYDLIDLPEDTDDIDGFIIFNDDYIKGTTYEERKQYAEGDLKTYTQWANGEVYTIWVTHPEHEGGDADTLSGMYGDDFGFQPVIDEAQSMIDDELSGPYHHDFVTAARASRYHL
jgi:hypothetical protein